MAQQCDADGCCNYVIGRAAAVCWGDDDLVKRMCIPKLFVHPAQYAKVGNGEYRNFGVGNLAYQLSYPFEVR